MVCLNKNSVEYQTLKNMSGLSDFQFDVYSSFYVEKYGRFPYLDELPKANSQPHLNNFLKIREKQGTNFSDTNRILDLTQSNSLEEAMIKINNKYRDLDTKIIDAGDLSIIQTKRRPSQWEGIYSGGLTISQEISRYRDSGVIISMLDKLARYYGINFKTITNNDLNTDQWKDIVLDSRGLNAFVYNNDIYINVDNADLNAPIHEMLHILLGSMRFQDPQTYFKLLDVIDKIPDKDKYHQLYLNRTNSDLNEEILVSEFAKYLTGQQTYLTDLPTNVLHNIQYNIKRTLDSMLSGIQSVKTIDDNVLFNSSMQRLAEIIGSQTLENKYFGHINDAKIHRILANTKQDLLKKGDLKELCN